VFGGDILDGDPIGADGMTSNVVAKTITAVPAAMD